MYISARNKGLITGASMILLSIVLYLVKRDFNNELQYIVYAVYVTGILWTLLIFKKETKDPLTFKSLFAEGFKCFIVVTLLMVLFTLIFILLHPEMKEQMVAYMKADSINKKDLTQADIDNAIESAKKFFLTFQLMIAVIGYLAIGTFITVLSSVFLSQNK
jgi:hypothetical protein